MTAWGAIVNTSFQHNQGIRHGNPAVQEGDGAPASAIGGVVGSLYWDETNSDGYICTVAGAASAATWVKINA